MEKTNAVLAVLFVRIAMVSDRPAKFFRCGERFTQVWRRVEVDQATAERLHAEQMLEVQEEQPEDYDAEADAKDTDPALDDAVARANEAAARAEAAASALETARAAAAKKPAKR